MNKLRKQKTDAAVLMIKSAWKLKDFDDLVDLIADELRITFPQAIDLVDELKPVLDKFIEITL